MSRLNKRSRTRRDAEYSPRFLKASHKPPSVIITHTFCAWHLRRTPEALRISEFNAARSEGCGGIKGLNARRESFPECLLMVKIYPVHGILHLKDPCFCEARGFTPLKTSRSDETAAPDFPAPLHGVNSHGNPKGRPDFRSLAISCCRQVEVARISELCPISAFAFDNLPPQTHAPHSDINRHPSHRFRTLRRYVNASPTSLKA